MFKKVPYKASCVLQFAFPIYVFKQMKVACSVKECRMDRSDLRSDARNYTDRKVQPKCKMSPLSN